MAFIFFVTALHLKVVQCHRDPFIRLLARLNVLSGAEQHILHIKISENRQKIISLDNVGYGGVWRGLKKNTIDK